MLALKQHKKTKNTGIVKCLIFFMASVCILGFPSGASAGAMKGLKISSSVIIPSLFPFTVCSVYFQKSGGLLWLSNKLDKITKKIFNFSGTEFSVILLSLLGGYPIGAKITNELFVRGELDKTTAKKLLRFCINPSPAFFISMVGMNIFKNTLVGVILFISNAISCLILSCLFTPKTKKPPIANAKSKGENFSDSFVYSVLIGAEITINICAFVVLFSAICEILKTMPISLKAYSFIAPFLEISFGITEISQIGIPTYFYGFLLSFGGISTIFQVKQAAKNINPSFIFILFHRIVHGFMTLLISLLLFKLFPINYEVFSSGTVIKFTEYPLFIPSVMLIIFSVLFLMFVTTPKEKLKIR